MARTGQLRVECFTTNYDSACDLVEEAYVSAGSASEPTHDRNVL